MKSKQIILTLIICNLILISSNETNEEESSNNKSFIKTINNFVLKIFYLIEQYMISFVIGLRARDITEPFDFLGCFILGCIIRILYLLLKSSFKYIFNIQDKTYIYNQIDSDESLYYVIKKLNELNSKIDNKEDNKENNENVKNDEIELDQKKIKKIEDDNIEINKKLNQIEKIIKSLEENYVDQKNKNNEVLKTIETCQKDIKDVLSSK